MNWILIVAIVIAIPIILFPAAYVWYINFGGVYMAIKGYLARRARAKQAKINVTGGAAGPGA
jgi:hypothetical protein